MIKNVKQPITSIIGLGMIVLTSSAIYRGTIQVIWEGAALLCIGSAFFLLPDEIPVFIKKIFKKLTGDGTNGKSNI